MLGALASRAEASGGNEPEEGESMSAAAFLLQSQSGAASVPNIGTQKVKG